VTRATIEPRLSAFDASMVVVSLVIGIGIFRTPALVARDAGGRFEFFAAWIAGGVLSLMGALTYAEIGSRLPRAGGYYKVVAECYHPRLAFMLNWSQALMQGAGAAGVAFIGAEYLATALRLGGGRPVASLAGVLMLTLLALNLIGVRAGARAQNVLSLAKIAMIAGVAVLAFARGDAPAAPATADSATGWGFISALVAVFYTYGGYQTAINLGADVRDPRRNLPRAVLGGMALVVTLYLLANAAYERVLGLSGVASSDLVAAALMRALFGSTGETLVSLAIFLSAAGFVNATILQVPRSYYAMAQDGALPAAFLHVHAGTQVQRAGLLFFAASMLLPAFVLGSFEKLLAYVMFSDALMLIVVASTVFVLRRRETGDDTQIFRLPGYPLLPLLFLMALGGVVLRLVLVETALAVAGSAVLLLGAPLHALARRASSTA
jgi:basic amino acid/polyamine antiporter, APA family